MPITSKIKLAIPKNRIKMYTVDKDGIKTGNEVITCNTWTTTGYTDLWLKPAMGGPISNLHWTPTSPDGPTSPQSYYIHVSGGTDPITVTSTTLNATNRFRSNTRVALSEGDHYPRADIVTVGGIECYKLTWLVSFAFGSINFAVGQVGLGPNDDDNIWCGTRINNSEGESAPFIVSMDEQLIVEYAFLIPTEYVGTDDDATPWQVTEVLVNGTDATNLSFSRTPVVATTDSSGISFRFYGSTVPAVGVNQNNIFVTHSEGTDFFVQDNDDDGYIVTNNGRTVESTFTLLIPPDPLGAVDIISISRRRLVDSHNNNLHIAFDPPIEKAETNQVLMTFKITVEIDEVDV